MLAAVGVLGRAVALLFNSAVSRTVGAEGMGLFGLVMTLYAFGVTFASAGISLAVTRLVASARDAAERTRAFRGAVCYALLFSGAITLVFFSFSVPLAEIFLSDVRGASSLRILALSFIPLSLTSVISGYFVGVRRVSRNAAVLVFSQLFRIVFTLFFLSRVNTGDAEAGAFAVSLGIVFSEIFSLFLSLCEYLFEKRARVRGAGDVKAVFKISFPLFVSTLFRSALLTLEHALIPKKLCDSGLTHKDALSSYGLLHGMALPLVLFPMSPLSSFAGLLVPEFSECTSKSDKKTSSKIASEAISKTLKYSFAVAFIILNFSEELGYAVYSSYEAGRFIAVLAPVIPIMYLDHVTDAVLKGIGEEVYSMWVNISDAVLSVLLVIFLIPNLGIMGYAVVILVMECYNFILSFIRLKSKITLEISIFKSLVFPLISLFISSFIVNSLFCSQASLVSPILLILKIAFSSLSFFFFDKLLSFFLLKQKHG
jgi:stage V sporulation protein B